MDSLTQIVLGSSVAALVVPPRHRRLAMLAGGVLGTLPDLDVLWFKLFRSDVVTEVTWHRGPSHSLLVLTALGWLLWLLFKSRSYLVQESPLRWLLAIWLALVTHPLLDAFTVYGTQMLWPMQTPPIMWATIFVIDPLYTVPLLIGVIAAWRLAPGQTSQQTHSSSRDRAARNWLAAGLLVSSLYLAWSVAAKLLVDRAASHSLVALNLQNAPRFSTPLPFNTLAWRVIVMVPDGYWLGDRSLIADRELMQFTFHASDSHALEQLAAVPQLKRLLWFTHGFVAASTQRHDDKLRLILTDLRMGLEPDYFFRYDIAGIDEHGNWAAAPEITQMPESGDIGKTLSWVWRRIYDSKASHE
ncbi:hypothetical protein Z042_19490 [Chania multitudinisentens RB-25]|uniref:Hydrolase n=1 Tax=Chania multitudinisentens RB-25 TaxID=1441930 RepID=W0LGM6_9GAMM|nr:metal-dependent hydrolase [Chania multitudinisentens]AHG21544.1 hypothetical protein Z042_19490 [Chania multitudinisentens RB-25]